MALPTALQSVLNNPLVKSALFKQLVKIMKDNSIELVTLSLDKDGKLQIEAYNKPTIVLDRKDYTEILLKAINKNLPND